jgi:hypothetical protein
VLPDARFDVLPDALSDVLPDVMPDVLLDVLPDALVAAARGGPSVFCTFAGSFRDCSSQIATAATISVTIAIALPSRCPQCVITRGRSGASA